MLGLFVVFEGLYVLWIGGGYVKRVLGYSVVLRTFVESRDSGKSASWEVLGRSGVPGTSWEQGVDVLIS